MRRVQVACRERRIRITLATDTLPHADGTDIPTLLSAIMTLLPLDETVPPAILMGMMDEHKKAGWQTPIWATYKEVCAVPSIWTTLRTNLLRFYALHSTTSCHLAFIDHQQGGGEGRPV